VPNPIKIRFVFLNIWSKKNRLLDSSPTEQAIALTNPPRQQHIVTVAELEHCGV
jgi:hypothetical protein